MDLLLACQRDDLGLIQDLLDKGTPVNYQNEDGVTPLQMASAVGQMTVACLLLSRGADVNISNHYGWTPLIHSLFHGHEDIALLLLQKGADIAAHNKLGLTPLAAACGGGHLTCVRFLMEYDSVTFQQDLQAQSDLSPVMAAALHGHDDLLKILFDQNININQAHNITKLTALMLAASNGQKTSVQTLVEHGADPNLTSVIHRTALDIASACEKWEVKAYLGEKTITQNISNETKTKEREEPLIVAIKQGNINELHRLLDVDPDACNRWSAITGLSPLMHAAIEGQAEATFLLLKWGAKINAQEKENKWTALMFAVFHRKTNVVSVLLDEGADIEMRACNDCTALDLVWVSDGGLKDLIELFIKSKNQAKSSASSPANAQLTTTLKSDSKRSFLRRSSGNSSFRAWMTSRFQHLKRTRSSNSLSAASPALLNDAMSDEDDDTIVFLPDNRSAQQVSQNTKWLKLSSLHFLRKNIDDRTEWINKQVSPPLLPSPSKWHSPLPKEYLPPLVDTKEQNFKPPKVFCPIHLLKRHNSLQKEMRAEVHTGENNRFSAGYRSSWRESLSAEGPAGNWSGVDSLTEARPSGEEDDVKHLLHHLSLDRYIPQFQAHEIDMEALKGVTEQDLQEIGVHSIGPRKQLIAAISHLQ